MEHVDFRRLMHGNLGSMTVHRGETNMVPRKSRKDALQRPLVQYPFRFAEITSSITKQPGTYQLYTKSCIDKQVALYSPFSWGSWISSSSMAFYKSQQLLGRFAE